MIIFPDLQFFLFIPIYFIAVFFAFFIPGDFFVKRLNLDFFSRITLSFIFGICLWATQGLIFGYLNLRNLSYFYVILFFIFWIADNRSFKKIDIPIDVYAVIISILGGLTSLSAIWLMGVRVGKTLFFCCRSVPDAIYHLSLTNELVKRFPPFEPGSTGIIVKNYHYLSNLVVADLSRVFNLPLIPTVYQYSPVFFIILLCFAISTSCKLISAPKIYKYLLLFFVFFFGDVNFLLVFFTSGKINFTFDVFDNASRILTAPPRIFSFVVFFGILCFIILWIKRRSLYIGLLVAVLTGVLIGFKVYTFVPIFVGLFTIVIYRFFFQKDKQGILIFTVAGLIALATYLPVNPGAGGFVFTGFWRVTDYVVKPELHLVNLELARQTFQAAGKWARVLGYEIYFLFLYLIFNFGTIILLSFFVIKRVRKIFPQEVFYFLFTGQIALLVLGIFFIQKTGGANTVQFLIIFETIGSIIAAAAVYILIKILPKYVNYIFIAVVIVLTGARVANEFIGNTVFYKDREKVIISSEEIDAFNYLSGKTAANSIIAVSPPFVTKNISLMVPFFSNREVFLAGTSDHGVLNLDKRIIDNRKLFQELNSSDFINFVKINKINYLYVPKEDTFVQRDSSDILKKVFENSRISVFKVL